MTIEQLIENLKMYPKEWKVKGKIFYKERENFVIFRATNVFEGPSKPIKSEAIVDIVDWDTHNVS